MCAHVSRVMIEFVLIAVLHLDGDIRGPDLFNRYLPYNARVYRRYVTMQKILSMTLQWNGMFIEMSKGQLVMKFHQV